MNRSGVCFFSGLVLAVTVTMGGLPVFGQAVKQPSGEGELQARDVVSILDAGDTEGLKTLISKHPRLPEAILTEDGVMALSYAAAAGKTPLLGILIEAKAPLNYQDKVKRTALYMAVANKQPDAALQLLAAGADTRLGDTQSVTPLHLAAKLGLTNVAEALIAKGADVNARTAEGTPPLAVAAYSGHVSTVQLLCEKSANVNDKNANGVTVLHYAVLSKKPEVVRYLVGKGARKEARDNEGKSPASWAKTIGHAEIEALLQQEIDPSANLQEADYASLLKQAKSNPAEVDFKRLRLAYAKTAEYKPYDSDDSALTAAGEALKKPDFPEVARLAESALAKNYLDPDAHVLCRIAYKQMENSAKYDFHTAILKAFAGSLYESGDGTSPEKAIVVLSVKEEYFFLRVNGLKLIKTSLMTADGHNYDKAYVEDAKTGQKTDIYFNIDIPYSTLTTKSGKK